MLSLRRCGFEREQFARERPPFTTFCLVPFPSDLRARCLFRCFSCDSQDYCYHNGMHFLNAHASFNLWVERNLQRIDPKVALAQWDFMLDAAHFGTSWMSSEIFGPDMFGSALGSPEKHYQISDGWFANITSAYDPKSILQGDSEVISTNHNAYGLVDATFNYQVRIGSGPARHGSQPKENINQLESRVYQRFCGWLLLGISTDGSERLDSWGNYRGDAVFSFVGVCWRLPKVQVFFSPTHNVFSHLSRPLPNPVTLTRAGPSCLHATHSQSLPGVIRTSSYCGVESSTEFTHCHVFVECFENNNSFYDWASCMEHTVMYACARGVLWSAAHCRAGFVRLLILW